MLFRLASMTCVTVALFFIPSHASAQSTNPAVARADAALQAAATRAQSDPSHPIFHVAAPANWVNDPNGPIFYHGYYHLFYQLQPFSDGDGPKYWGHVRSHDLVKWEHLPVALWPSTEKGETGVWSGSCTINGNGDPIIFYTSVTSESAQTHAEQWAAIGDQDLLNWRKLPENPVLSEALHGDRKIYEWRDPFVFHSHDRTFLVAGGNLNKTAGGQAVVNIYEAQNPGLTEWKYRGILFHLPDADARTTECPNFFNIGNKWVLMGSPYGPVQYYIGDFDVDTFSFHSHSRGQVDFGPNFYAPNTMLVPDGRRIMWGWVTGFPDGHGYKGCLTLPRLLSVSSDGKLVQTPAPQLRKLRGKSVSMGHTPIPADGLTFQLPPTNTLEIHAEIIPNSSTNISISLQSSAAPVDLAFTPSEVALGDSRAPLSGSNRAIDLTLFIDRSVLEVYVNNSLAATKVVPTVGSNPTLKITSADPSAHARRLESWPLKSIW